MNINDIKQVSILCPNKYCNETILYEIKAPARSFAIECPSCSTKFNSQVVVVRSKRSRGKKVDDILSIRDYSVRVWFLTGEEDLFEFSDSAFLKDRDFELRQRDVAIFTYLNNRLTIIQNLTINRYITFYSYKRELGKTCLILLSVFVGIFFLCGLVFVVLFIIQIINTPELLSSLM